MSIFVGNLPFRAEKEDVLQLFSPFGEITNCSLPLERDTGRKRGFAFVEMADEALETAAIEALQGTELMGRPLRINKAEPRGASPRRNNGYGSPRGSSNSSGYGSSGNNNYNSRSAFNNGGYANTGGSYSSNTVYDSNGGANYVDNNSSFSNRPSGAKGWEDRSYGNPTENSDYENGRSRRRRGTSNDINDSQESN